MTLASVGQVVSQGAAQNGCAWMAAAIMMTLVQDDIPASRKPSLIAWDGVSPPPLNAAPPPRPPPGTGDSYTRSYISHCLAHGHKGTQPSTPLKATPPSPRYTENTGTSLPLASQFRFTSPNVAFLGCFTFN